MKWKGYEKLEDHTWEEEEGLMYVHAPVELRHLLRAFIDKHNRDGARDIVTAYYKRIGGRPTKKDGEKPAAAKPGRKRKSMGDSKVAKAVPAPAGTEAKRQRRKSAPKETSKEASPSSEENGIQWLPKGKNWDKDVKEVDTIVREGDAGLMAWLEFNNGRKAKLSVQACYEKCPLKVCPPPPCRRNTATRLLITKLDAQVLRIAPVSYAHPMKARNTFLTSLIVSLRIIDPVHRQLDISPTRKRYTSVIFLGHFFNLGCAIASGHR